MEKDKNKAKEERSKEKSLLFCLYRKFGSGGEFSLPLLNVAGVLEETGYKSRNSLSAALVVLAKKDCLEKTGRKDGTANVYKVGGLKLGALLPPLELTPVKKRFFDEAIKNIQTEDGITHFRLSTTFVCWGVADDNEEEKEQLASFFEKMIDQRIIVKVAEDKGDKHRLSGVYRLHGDGTNFWDAIGRVKEVSEETTPRRQSSRTTTDSHSTSTRGIQKIKKKIAEIDRKISELTNEKIELKFILTTISDLKSKLTDEQLLEIKKLL